MRIKKHTNGLCIISKTTFGEYAIHDIQTNSSWTGNPYEDEYAIVPDELIEDIMETSGFCEIVLNEDGTEVVSFAARDIPEIPEPESDPTVEEQLRADIDFIAAMTGVTL